MHELPAIDITAENFAPFGWLIEQPHRSADIESTSLRYWDRVVPYGEALVSPNLGFLQLSGIPANEMFCDQLEIIPDATETYLCLDAVDAVLVVAHGSLQQPDLATARAFRLHGSSVVVRAGVWHQHPLPIDEDSNYGLLTSNGVLIREPVEPPSSGNNWQVVVNSSQVLTIDTKIHVILPDTPVELVWAL